tara:strand:+ start:6489 stop:8243 length:1755 start_codon:yes stop_codon:yes gene_type:complete
MATTSSTKPGEIGGTSILAKRSPTYRLVLKVDATTGQYKYEYEVDNTPTTADLTTSTVPDTTTPPDTGGDVDNGDSSPTPGPTIPENPGTSFEQTKKMLGGGDNPNSPANNRDTGAYRMNNDGSVGYRRANQDSFITVSKTSPGAQKFMAGLTKGVSSVTNTISDYVSTGGIIGTAAKNLFSGKKAAEFDATNYNTMPAGFVDGESTEEKNKVEASFNPNIQQQKYNAPSTTVPSVNAIQDSLSKLKNRRKQLAAGITSGEMYAGTIANIDREIQQTNSLLNREIANTSTSTSTPTKPTSQQESSNAYDKMEAAVTDGNVAGAIDAAKRSAGFAGSSRDTAERNMNDAAIGAGTNNENANYGNNETSSQRREREDSDGIGAAREAAGNSERSPGTSVDTNNAVDNAARSNEVSDRNGNAVTNTNSNTGVTTAVTFGGSRKTRSLTRADVAANKAKKQKEKKAKDKDKDKSTRIICTELYNQRLISKEDYMLDLYYTSKHLTPQHTTGYWHFAVPAVKAMRRSKFWTAFWREIAYNRLQDIKWRLGYGKFTLKGRIYSAIFEPFCYISGYFKPNATYKELYKGEY